MRQIRKEAAMLICIAVFVGSPVSVGRLREIVGCLLLRKKIFILTG
jgi:hypothetical protein